MAYIVALVLCFSAIILLAMPVIKRSYPNANQNDLEERINNLRWEQDQIYEDIQSLVLDHEIENISEPEYTAKLQQYRTDAAAKISQEEHLKRQRKVIAEHLESQVYITRQNIRYRQDK